MGNARVELLGPLRLVVDGAVVEVRGFLRRALLARLALAEGRVVSVEQLVDTLWPDRAQYTDRQALHSLVSRLRHQLGPAGDRLITTPEGYRLALGGDGFDLAVARALLRAARAELDHDPASAHARLLQAHGLWRGPVMADLADLAPFAAAAEEAENLHREVTDTLISAAVAAGQSESVLAMAASAVEADPLRERAVLMYMRALAATGEIRAALQVARGFRRRLAEETGLDPSPALRAAEQAAAAGATGPAVGVATPPTRQLTPLFGRDAEVATLHRLLASDRLVTVLGPGGVGKTRLAMEVAHRADTVTVLLLAPVTDPGAVPFALADAMGLTVSRGDVLAACSAMLADGSRLLVVDNAEHLLDAIRDLVANLLASCPQLKVLATSREPLGLTTEHAFRLAPLPTTPLPGTMNDPARSPAVDLFLDRAARVRSGAVAPAEVGMAVEVVRRLDGMPLAIELAAGRLSTFSVPDLLARLDRALDLLAEGRPGIDSRQRSLRATLDWSYQLLADDERRLFRHLAVFVDGVDLDTAEQVATDLGLPIDPGSVLARLVDASMLEATFTGPRTRYRMLEALRAFALDRLAVSEEADAAAARLVQWALDLARWFDQTVATDAEAEADATLRRELANLRAAWRTVRRRGLVEDAAAMVASLFDAVMTRDLVEVRAWARELADDPALRGRPHAAAVFGAAAYAAYAAGEQDMAEEYARTGLVEGGDGVPHCRHALAVSALARGACEEAIEHCLAPDAVADERHGLLGIAALASAYAGDLDRAQALNDRWLAQATSPSRRAWATYYQAEIDNLSSRNDLAEQRYLEAIALGGNAGDSFVIGVATIGLVTLRTVDGRVDDALAGYSDAIELFARTGYWTHQWITLRNLAALLQRLDDHETAQAIEAAADAAPDAPAIPATSRHLALLAGSQMSGPPRPAGPLPGRTEILDIARRAIDRHAGR